MPSYIPNRPLDRRDSFALGSMSICSRSMDLFHSHVKPHGHMRESTGSLSALSLSLLRQVLRRLNSSSIDVCIPSSRP